MFVIMAAPPIAMMLHDFIKRARSIAALNGLLTVVDDICADLRSLERNERYHALSAAALLMLAVLFAAGKNGFEGEFNSESFPHQAIPVIEASTAQHIFTFDQWGDYLIYRLYPARRVFIDGRCDFYGDKLVDYQGHILDGRHDWKKLLNQFSVDMVIVKPEAPLSSLLKSEHDWKVLLDDGKVIVFAARHFRAEGSKTSGIPEHLSLMFHPKQHYLVSTSCLQDKFRTDNS